MEKNISDRNVCCLGRIFRTTDRLQQIQKNNNLVKGKSLVEESVAITFPYQINRKHAMEPSTVGHIILRKALGMHYRFH